MWACTGEANVIRDWRFHCLRLSTKYIWAGWKSWPKLAGTRKHHQRNKPLNTDTAILVVPWKKQVPSVTVNGWARVSPSESTIQKKKNRRAVLCVMIRPLLVLFRAHRHGIGVASPLWPFRNDLYVDLQQQGMHSYPSTEMKTQKPLIWLCLLTMLKHQIIFVTPPREVQSMDHAAKKVPWFLLPLPLYFFLRNALLLHILVHHTYNLLLPGHFHLLVIKQTRGQGRGLLLLSQVYSY